MYRTALLSLLIGVFIVCSAGLLIDSVGQSRPQSDRLSWGSGDLRVVVGSNVKSGEGLLLELNESGQGVVEVPGKLANLDELSFLHLDLTKGSGAETLTVAWRTATSGSRLLLHRVAIAPVGSLWLRMNDAPGWQGNAKTIGLVFLGPPGGRVQIKSLELAAPVFPYNALAILGQWTDFGAWKNYSINAHLGVNSRYFFLSPVPVALAVFIASAASYLLSLLILKRRRLFELRVVALLFLACWMTLDMVWQDRLLRQLYTTGQTFAGKTPVEKREAGQDAQLFGFVNRVRDEIGPGVPRVFVSSTDDYAGMRGAYYLYPANVYWQRKPQSLPEAEFISRGDYLVLLQPTDARYDAISGTLLYGDESSLSVRRILSTPTGDLYKVI